MFEEFYNKYTFSGRSTCLSNEKDPSCSPGQNYQKLLCRRQQLLGLGRIRHFFFMLSGCLVVISNCKSNASLGFFFPKYANDVEV